LLNGKALSGVDAHYEDSVAKSMPQKITAATCGTEKVLIHSLAEIMQNLIEMTQEANPAKTTQK
jgi:hypothetical protein